jgi:hypothetical protein
VQDGVEQCAADLVLEADQQVEWSRTAGSVAVRWMSAVATSEKGASDRAETAM